MRSCLRYAPPIFCVLIIASPVFATDCSSPARERSDYVGAELIKMLDAGRHANGSYPAWVESYMRDAESFGEALASYCEREPKAGIERAFQTISKR